MVTEYAVRFGIEVSSYLHLSLFYGIENHYAYLTIIFLQIRSVALGFQSIVSGSQNVLICGGQESMSKAPHVLPLRNGTKYGDATLQDTLTKDGLTDAMCNAVMGITAENVAKRFQVNREEQDAYAAGSQQRTAEAQRTGFFDAEIVAVSVPGSRGAVTVVGKDEFPRNETTAESLAKLRPCFIRVRQSFCRANDANDC